MGLSTQSEKFWKIFPSIGKQKLPLKTSGVRGGEREIARLKNPFQVLPVWPNKQTNKLGTTYDEECAQAERCQKSKIGQINVENLVPN